MDFPYPEYIHELIQAMINMNSKNIIQIWGNNLFWNLKSREICEISNDYHFLFPAFKINFSKIQNNYQKPYLFHKFLLEIKSLNCFPLEKFSNFKKIICNTGNHEIIENSQIFPNIKSNQNINLYNRENINDFNFAYIRHIKKDNNSFYRSIYIAFIEKLISLNRLSLLITKIKEDQKMNYFNNMVNEAENYYDILISTINKIENMEEMGRFSFFLYINIYLEFDYAMITYIKEVLKHFKIKANNKLFKEKQYNSSKELKYFGNSNILLLDNNQEKYKEKGTISNESQEMNLFYLIKFFEIVFKTKIIILNFDGNKEIGHLQ